MIIEDCLFGARIFAIRLDLVTIRRLSLYQLRPGDLEFVRLFQNFRYYPSPRQPTKGCATLVNQICGALNSWESDNILLPIDRCAEGAFSALPEESKSSNDCTKTTERRAMPAPVPVGTLERRIQSFDAGVVETASCWLDDRAHRSEISTFSEIDNDVRPLSTVDYLTMSKHGNESDYLVLSEHGVNDG